jgi:two-component system chemotaxis response regulator CheB
MLTASAPIKREAVVIGGSAGSIQALLHLLPALGPNPRLPIVIVVHLPPRRASLLPELFSDRCSLLVREPCDKEPVLPGIWFAPPDYHLLIEKGRTFSLSLDDPHLHSRPSIDALFESAADSYGSSLVGIVLTGASRDGARGARVIVDGGGLCFALAPLGPEELSTMPSAAIEEGATPASLDDLAGVLRVACEAHPSEAVR